MLRQEEVDVMLQDVRLPGISGFDVLRIVKENYSLVEVLKADALAALGQGGVAVCSFTLLGDLAGSTLVIGHEEGVTGARDVGQAQDLHRT